MTSKAGATAGGALSGAATGAAIGSVVPGVGTAVGAVGGAIVGGLAGYLSVDDEAEAAEKERKRLLYAQAVSSGQFADQAQQMYGQQGQAAYDYLGGVTRGENSVSAEQLRQGLAQMYGQQASAAAGAAPRNQAMASRAAMRNMMFAGQGMAGQQALAGMQERNQAWNQIGTLRGQDLQAALGARQNAMVGYGASNVGAPPQSWAQQWGPPIVGALGAYAQMNKGGGGSAPATSSAPAASTVNTANGVDYMNDSGYWSDRALKSNIKPGDDAANAAIATLAQTGPQTYVYKDPRLGAGPQVGVMAQDLQRAGLAQAVVPTKQGLAVDSGKLTGANTAMIAALGQRVQALESPPSPPLPSWATRLRVSPAQAAYAASPTGQRQTVLDAARNVDPQAVASQEALDHRRSMLQELALRQAGAYPGGYRTFDTRGNVAHAALNDRRAAIVAAPQPLPSWAYRGAQ